MACELRRSRSGEVARIAAAVRVGFARFVERAVIVRDVLGCALLRRMRAIGGGLRLVAIHEALDTLEKKRARDDAGCGCGDGAEQAASTPRARCGARGCGS